MSNRAELIAEGRRIAALCPKSDASRAFTGLCDALEAAESPTTVEWGVRITTVGHDTLHASKESAEADVEFWKNRIEPDPNATKFPRALIMRIAATEWEVVAS
ncbi:hypothetical protein D6T64_11945 [Cryobacterium melibiosiphilum]|uniref:Uncharacterized protein n=1 Tax=Cryobacterium melibiosiphilum TaxID=995039 RepID=A0A3A5MG58_9MICO|nr:hypothetical protein [Cryobacterium melibiosiphilum]RJT88095.1 hypothetical protein D6T64_11945 [Cryobacterium melibiosiphilum]